MNRERPLSYDDILQIAKLIDSTDNYKKFKLQYGDIVLEIEKVEESSTSQVPSVQTSLKPPTHERTDQVAATIREEVPKVSFVAGEKQNDKMSSKVEPHTDFHIVKAPMVGTFYRCPQPGAPPFVEVGQRVKKGDTVCLIEVMKLFNTIEAGQDGVVVDILVEDGQPIEYGQHLIVIDPNA